MATEVFRIGGVVPEVEVTHTVEVSELVIAGCVAMTIVERRRQRPAATLVQI